MTVPPWLCSGRTARTCRPVGPRLSDTSGRVQLLGLLTREELLVSRAQSSIKQPRMFSTAGPAVENTRDSGWSIWDLLTSDGECACHFINCSKSGFYSFIIKCLRTRAETWETRGTVPPKFEVGTAHAYVSLIVWRLGGLGGRSTIKFEVGTAHASVSLNIWRSSTKWLKKVRWRNIFVK